MGTTIGGSAGELRVHESFRSRFLAQARTITVYLPPGYQARGRRRYPVLYLQDGQNVFERPAPSGVGWRVNETADSLIAAGRVEPLIIVAVDHAGEHRVDEYAPSKVEEKGGGSADLYGRMLVEELKPFVDAKYKTLSSAASTGLGGSSLGGLVTLHLGLTHPEVFSRLVALSPSIWWDKRLVVREVEALAAKPPLRIWLDAGTEEGAEALTDARALRDALVAKGWVVGHDLQFVEAQGGRHDERSWGERMHAVLKALFSSRGDGGSSTRG